MENIYEILAIEQGCSSVELKEAFLSWKKEQQEILKHGKPNEQRQATERITKATILYKEAVKKIKNVSNDDDVNTIKRNVVRSNIVEVNPAETNLTSTSLTPRENNQILNIDKMDKIGKTLNNNFEKVSQIKNNFADINVKLLSIVIAVSICTVAGSLYIYNNTTSLKAIYYKVTGNYPEPPVPPVPPKMPEMPEVPKFLVDDEKISSDNKVKDDKKVDKKEKVAENKKETPVTDEDIAKKVFVDYNNALGNHNFDEAYNLMSPKRQKSMGSPSHFAEGFTDTLESKVTDLRLAKTGKDELVFDYVLESKDRMKGNKVLYQTFKGQVHMFKVNGQWKVGYSESKKTGETIK
ncbi:MAG: hypothetical protein SO022_08650 [Selenomonadaceae bacterium]|nr:hypothetical protein [Selenomonadaceae bacterium]